MKVVVDTNVIISGIFWSGVPGRIIELWAAELFTLCVSFSILEEYAEIIDRVGIKYNCPSMARRWNAYLFEHSEMVEVICLYNACRDPDDNKFVECAVSAGATNIVSGDDDLLSLGEFESVQIVTPADFLKKFSV